MGYGNIDFYLSKKRKPLEWTDAQLEARRRRLEIGTKQAEISKIVEKIKRGKNEI